MHNICFQFVQGITLIPRETEVKTVLMQNLWMGRGGGGGVANKVYQGQSESCEWKKKQVRQEERNASAQKICTSSWSQVDEQ